MKVDQHQKLTVYSAESSRRNLLYHLKNILHDLPDSHELGLRLFKRNLKAQYRQSLLGFLWALLPPLMTAALWIFLRKNVMSMDDTSIPYPVFVLIGSMLWQIFTESIQAPIKSVAANKAMLVKINIPKESLLLSGIYELLFNVLVKIGLLAIILLVFRQEVGLTLFMVPVGIVAIIICGFSMGLILTPIGMLYHDIQRGLAVILPFLMYLTPVVYPKPAGGAVAQIMKFNPMATIISETRHWLTAQPGEAMTVFWMYAGFFALLFFLGIVVYRLALPMIIERIGS